MRELDVVVAKNYLGADEVDTLNRLVLIFLEPAELRVKDRKQLTLAFWSDNVDRLLDFNDRPVLKDNGSVSARQMKAIAQDRYEAFDTHRRNAEAAAADGDDLRELEDIRNRAKRIHGA